MSTHQQLHAIGIPCFTRGTLINTPRGEVPIETLKVGDLVLTRDRGPKPVVWIGRRSLDEAELDRNPQHRPILIPENVLGNHTRLFVSPLHGMLIDSGYAGAQSLVRAKHLAEAKGPIRVAFGKKRIEYIHLMFENHEIITANGAEGESFYPGFEALKLLATDEKKRLFSAFPELKEQPAQVSYGPRCRAFMKRKDVLGLGADLLQNFRCAA